MIVDEEVTDKPSRTGATGYIGGDLLSVIAKAHPDWQISALVRTDGKAQKVKEQYPNVRIVMGDLDSADLIEEEVKKADIVYRKSIQGGPMTFQLTSSLT